MRQQSSHIKPTQLTRDSVLVLEMTLVAKYRPHCPENIIFFVSEALRWKGFKMLEPLVSVNLGKEEDTQATWFIIKYFFRDDFAL